MKVCFWPLAAHLDFEIGAGFGSAVGWKAEPIQQSIAQAISSQFGCGHSRITPALEMLAQLASVKGVLYLH